MSVYQGLRAQSADAVAQKVAAHLVEVFNDPEALKDYNDTAETFEIFGGWAGSMSPISRAAFVKEYGEQVVTAAETLTRMKMEKTRNDYASTQHAKFTQQAQQHRGAGSPAPAAGSFVFAVTSWMKQGGDGIAAEVEDLATTYERRELSPVLCKVERIFNVSAEAFGRPGDDDKLVAKIKELDGYFPGGAESVDDGFKDPQNEYRTFYTLTAAVICEDLGRWYLIDSEGYDYARYLLAPETWPTMYADEVQKAEEKARRKEEEEKAEQKRAKAARLEEYRKRCASWSPILQNLDGLLLVERETLKECGYNSKEYKAARRRLQNAKRANIKRMIVAAFPGLAVSVREGGGFGVSYTAYYTDGPTEEEMTAATALDLFTMTAIDFDGMTDCSEYIHAEFTDFAAHYFGQEYGSVAIRREHGPEREKLAEQLAAVLPGLNLWNVHDFTAEEAEKIAAAWGADVSEVWRSINSPYGCTPGEMVSRFWASRSFKF